MRVFVIQIATKLINLSIETVDFCLITSFCIDKVVRTVTVSELVDNAGIELCITVIDVVSHLRMTKCNGIVGYSIVQSPDKCRLNVNLPSLSLTEIESKIQCDFRSQIIAFLTNGNETAHIVILTISVVETTITESVSPTETSEGNNFKRTRFTLISAKPVAKINGTQQRSVQETNSRTCRAIRLVREISITLNSQAEHRRKVTTDAQSNIRIQVAHPPMTGSFSGQTTVDTDVEVVESLTFFHSLSRNRCCQQCSSKH